MLDARHQGIPWSLEGYTDIAQFFFAIQIDDDARTTCFDLDKPKMIMQCNASPEIIANFFLVVRNQRIGPAISEFFWLFDSRQARELDRWPTRCPLVGSGGRTKMESPCQPPLHGRFSGRAVQSD